MKVQYADEAVVVINLKPMKARNGLEEKTKGTQFSVTVADMGQKLITDAKGRRNFKVYLAAYVERAKVLKES